MQFRREKVLKILHRTIHIHFLSRNNQAILIIVFPNVLPQEEAQCGSYQPKQLKFVKKLILKILFTVIYENFQAILMTVKILCPPQNTHAHTVLHSVLFAVQLILILSQHIFFSAEGVLLFIYFYYTPPSCFQGRIFFQGRILFLSFP